MLGYCSPYLIGRYMSLPEITVVIINREDENPYTTLSSLSLQTIPFQVVVVFDQNKGANFARNVGAEKVRSEFVIFSDNDIEWEKDALENLFMSLHEEPSASYSYGSYEMEGIIYCDQPFNIPLLKKKNYISTMSLLRSKDFISFDEKIERLQDWDLWLMLLSQKKTGIYCGKKIFSTKKRLGITFGNDVSWERAREIVIRKHDLL